LGERVDVRRAAEQVALANTGSHHVLAATRRRPYSFFARHSVVSESPHLPRDIFFAPIASAEAVGEGAGMGAGELGVHTMVLSGPITLYETTVVRDRLRGALAEERDLRIDLASSGPWDVAGLQLLISAVATGKTAGLSVKLDHVPAVCREIAERSGLSSWLAGAAESYQ
jgi:ABC-type transporter Mla MlaB component